MTQTERGRLRELLGNAKPKGIKDRELIGLAKAALYEIDHPKSRPTVDLEADPKWCMACWREANRSVKTCIRHHSRQGVKQ